MVSYNGRSAGCSGNDIRKAPAQLVPVDVIATTGVAVKSDSPTTGRVTRYQTTRSIFIDPSINRV